MAGNHERPGSADSLRSASLAFLEAHNVLTLATCGPDGPWAAAVFYATRGFQLYFLSAPTTRHGRALAANPRVAGTIQDDTADWQRICGVQLEGTARVLAGEAALEARALYARKYPFIAGGAAALVAALARVEWYELDATRLYLVDNRAGFGHRDEVPIR